MTTPAYDLLEEFGHSLSNEDFNARWSALGWPLRATRRLHEVQQKQQVEQEERFRAVQQHDLSAFNERLDSLQAPTHRDTQRTQTHTH
ncbi:dynein axonemal heavy chain 1-like, partial [Petromyzon marinus]|uniref:dynein axonemal heavy chain 1-like n=1 Tax=Petromyzon marinus TaxID=7757 RepID=UPI003F725FB8